MAETAATRASKTREMHNPHMDSTRWNGFPFRDDDIVIATWGKCGTTWMQQILSQLIFRGREDVHAHELSPWLDMRIMPWPETLHKLEAQTHRRFIKTHLPVDALEMSPKAKYLYIARDPRDVAFSMHNHHRAFRPEFLEALNGVPGRVGPALEPTELDARAYYHQWLDGDGHPFWPFWSHVQSWWDIRDRPNVRLVHYANLKLDMAGEIRAIADFLEMEIPPEAWPRIIEHSGFGYMKANAEALAPMIEMVLEGGAQTFINKGENRRWAEVLSAEEAAKAETLARAKLTPDCARWLFTGETP
jgi:aryl sulfotransferase